MIFAVVPAAGHSTRMGRPKLTLLWNDRPIIEHVVAALSAGGADRVLVVTAPHVPELAAFAEKAGAEVCRLASETPDMRATVEHGLRWLEEHYRPRPEDAWLLAPADHPVIDPAIVRRLCAAYGRPGDRSIILPCHEQKRGHPTLITWRHVAGIRAHPAGEGLNSFFRKHADETLEIPVADAGVLCDLDTPEDYERLQQKSRRGSV